MIENMPIPVDEFDEAQDLSELASNWIEKLGVISKKLGLTQEEEVRTKGGKIDLVWYQNFEQKIPSIGEKLPLIGFEIETSWRTRKHIKGDIFNLMELNPSLGVILFLSEGFKDKSKFKGLLKASKKYSDSISGLSNIQIWTDEDVIKIHNTLFEIMVPIEPSPIKHPRRAPRSNREKIVQYLEENEDGSCDDCISTRLKITPRQQVNQICRRLANSGTIQRTREICPFCQNRKLNNRLIIATP